MVLPKFAFAVATLVCFILSSNSNANSKLAFWDEQRRGANGGAEDGTDEWFAAAAKVGIEYIRLSPNNMKSDSRDFLLGDAEKFFGIPGKPRQRTAFY